MKDIFDMVLIGAGVAFLAVFVVAPFKISGESMEPTYKSGQVVLVDKVSLRFREPKLSEVVVVNTSYGVMIKRVERRMEEDKYWIEGDNKNFSTDSRDYGPVSRQQIVGRVLVKVY